MSNNNYFKSCNHKNKVFLPKEGHKNKSEQIHGKNLLIKG